MKALKKWWDGEPYMDASPGLVYLGVRKPWLRTFYDKHAKTLWTGLGAVVLMVIGKLLDKLL